MKSDIRTKLIQLRREKNAVFENSVFPKLRKNFFELVSELQCKVIAGYYPLPDEINILPILSQASKLGYNIALPKIVNNNILLFKAWKIGAELKLNSKFKVLEPQDECQDLIPDLIIAPLLGFDRSGHRIGYGQGYYDRTLSYYHEAISVGICYSFQEVSILPTSHHDVSLDYVVTENEVIIVNDQSK